MYYIFLTSTSTSPYHPYPWPTPVPLQDGTFKPGEWTTAEGNLSVYGNGIHACGVQSLLDWAREVLYEAEVQGEQIISEEEHLIVVRKARLLKPIPAWNERTLRLFAIECAERVLPIWGTEYPKDDRPRRAIEAARGFVEGTVSAEKLSAARSAASLAHWYASVSAARYVTSRGVGRIEWSGRCAAPCAISCAAPRATWDVAQCVAFNAIASVTSCAGKYAEWEWQTTRLAEMLGLEDSDG